MTEVTLLLPNYNNARALPWLFASLRRTTDCSRHAFLMVDDGSEDDGVNIAKHEAPACGFSRVEIIEAPHRGVVEALNTGLAAARSPIVVRIDGDATAETPGWVERLARILSHGDVGMVSGQVLWETGRIHSFGRSVVADSGLHDMGCAPLEAIGSRTFDSLVYRPFGSFRGGPLYEVDTALGVCAAFRKKDALAVGGFDRSFSPVWIEDDDFGLSLRAAGLSVVIDPFVHFIHRPSLRGSRQPSASKNTPTSAITSPDATNLRPARDWAGIKRRLARTVDALAGRPILYPPAPPLEALLPVEDNPWRTGILQSHYATWERKWGFSALNPSLEEIFQTRWDTPLCWKHNPRLAEKSRKLLTQLQTLVP